MQVLVTGGTGTLGRLVVPLLRSAGQDVRVLSRHEHVAADGIEYVVGDLATGDGVEAATAGVVAVVHCGGSAKGDEGKARHLVQAAARAGVSHLVFISVVGADRVPIVSAFDRAIFGYFGSKLAAERVVTDSGVPWTTLRATQFFELTLMTAVQMARMPVIPVPAGVRFQPVDAGEVAARLVQLTLGKPAGLVSDMAGPSVYPMGDLIRGYLHATHRRRMMVSIGLPGKAARAIREGANLSLERAAGHRTWEDHLLARAAGNR